MNLRAIFPVMVASAVILTGAYSHADSTLRANSTIKAKEAVDSPNWSCSYTQKANLGHEPDGSVAALTLTIASFRCLGKNSEAGTYADFHVACITSSRDVNPEIKECVRSSHDDLAKFSWESAVVSETAKKTGLDKYGRKCTYVTTDKKARVAYRLQGNGTFSVTCATPIVCDNYNKGPKHWVVACKAAAEIPQKDGTSIDVCPQPADCVEDELPLAAPHASLELASFSKSISAAQNETVISSKKKTH